MAKRYEGRAMRLIGAFHDGQFRIIFGQEGDTELSGYLPLGEGPSLVEALDDALQNAIAVEEDWRRKLGE